jgi:hypothetical protein
MVSQIVASHRKLHQPVNNGGVDFRQGHAQLL